MAQIIWHTCSFWVFLLKLPLLLQDDARLIKQRRALLESNSPRNSQRETHRNDGLGGGSQVAPHYCYSPDRVVHGLPTLAECRNQVHVGRTNRRKQREFLNLVSGCGRSSPRCLRRSPRPRGQEPLPRFRQSRRPRLRWLCVLPSSSQAKEVRVCCRASFVLFAS